MRILFVSDTYYPHINGVYYFVCRIAPMLQAEGHEVAVIAPSETMSASFKKIYNIHVYGIPSFSVLFYSTIRIPFPFLKKRRIRKIIKYFNPDIIHIQDHFLICKAVLRLNRELKIPIIATNHFMPENLTMLVRSPKLKKFFEKLLWKDFSKAFNQVQLVTTPTETGVDIIRNKLNVETIAISSGIDLEKFTPFGDTKNIKEKYNIPDKPILLYAGRIDPEKHIEEILQAVAIASKRIDFCFIIVGKGISKKSLEEMVDELGINKNVIFTGFVPNEDLPYFFKLSRCFVIASIAELLSLVTLQAMASGLPIIAVKAGALVELVKNNENGYLYNEGDLQSLVQYIENILTNDIHYEEMGKKSLEMIQQHDINNTLQSFEKIYQTYALTAH
ncbi:MAG: glycosyltransferase [Ginsengibacter sp.]